MRALFARAAAVALLAGAGLLGGAAAAASDEAAVSEDAERPQAGAPAPRRPGPIRPEADLRFPEPVLPRGRLRPTRPETGALEVYLGPIQKEVVVGEGTPLAALQRVAALPNTRVAFATRGGNALHPEDVRRLSRLPAVDVHLTAPLLDVHLEVLRRIPTVAGVVLRMPPDATPDPGLGDRLGRTGPGRRAVVLEGALQADRVAALAGLRRMVLTVRLPGEGIDAELRGALERAGTEALHVVVPATARPEAIATLADLDLEAVILETDGNRLRDEVLAAAAGLGVRTRVRVDGRLSPEDLRRLKGIARLELLVWLGEATDVPIALTDLLLATEGIRPAPAPQPPGSP
jgi:hypothetical protein